MIRILLTCLTTFLTGVSQRGICRKQIQIFKKSLKNIRTIPVRIFIKPSVCSGAMIYRLPNGSCAPRRTRRLL